MVAVPKDPKIDRTPAFGWDMDPKPIWLGILQKHPNEGEKWQKKRFKIFLSEWKQYQAFNYERANAKKPAKTWNFWKWWNYQFAKKHESEGLVGGVVGKLANSPGLSIGLSLVAPGVVPILAGAAGGSVAPASIAATETGSKVSFGLQANLAQTKKGQQALLLEGVALTTVLGAVAPAAAAPALGLFSTALGVAGDATAPDLPTSAPAPTKAAVQAAPAGNGPPWGWIVLGVALAWALARA